MFQPLNKFVVIRYQWLIIIRYYFGQIYIKAF
jgi:hypothetical protein